jgi:flagellar motor switch protein FliN/FliY|tara:strand:- start:218 stop:430 length:213 start_codon:yes stop_codon:yes gene_type:complete
MAVLGTAMMEISQVLKLGRGAFVELDHNFADDIDTNANNRVVTRGQVLVNDDILAVSLTSLVKLAPVDTG